MSSSVHTWALRCRDANRLTVSLRAGSVIRFSSTWVRRGSARLQKLRNSQMPATAAMPRIVMVSACANRAGLPSPSIMWVRLYFGCTTKTSVTWMTMNSVKNAMPRKCSERAAWRPPKSFGYHGNRPTTAGDMTGPVTIISGAATKTTKKYISCCSASYGWKCSIDGTPRPA